MRTKGISALLAAIVASALLVAPQAMAAEFSASFKNTDIQEFINTVGKNLNKTIIVDPSVRGKINVRSYDLLNDEQYYQFFLSVLDVYGFAVVPMDNGTLKVVRSNTAKTSGIPVVDDAAPGSGDEMVTRVVPVRNVSVRELAPLLRQLNDNAGGGNVVHYEPSNVLLITGRAMVVNRLVDIVRRVDKAGDQDVDIVRLKYASATEIVRLVTALTKDEGKTGMGSLLTPKVVADDRTNSVVVSGEPKARQRVLQMIRQLDKDQQSDGNTKVYYLKYAKAKNLMEVLTGVSKSIQDKKTPGGQATNNDKKLSIEADEQTNSLVITAQPDTMQELEKVIARLDIRRAQVLVEAIIVEVANGNDAQFGIQWGNSNAGMVQFADSTTSPIPVSTFVDAIGDSPSDSSTASLAGLSGAALGFYHGDWFGLVTALKTDSKSDVLATPSLSTMDNQEAEFNVGQEVPVLTGSQTSTDSSTVYNTVERKTVGTKLKFKPQINEGDSVLLEIEQEVSSVDSTSANSSLGSTFNVRTIKNTVLVKSGETVVLGGLLDEKTNEVVSKVPVLGDIPVLGELFKSTSTDKTKRNLMVFIRPVILRDPVTYSGISNSKYTMFRAEQLERASKGLRLMPDDITTPVMPEFKSDTTLSPEMQKEIENYRARQSDAAAAARAAMDQ
ncbi:type II secretion system secretin GspD [Pseudaeromonas sharmana]|uniref:Type II secretion system secretin GspD n=1 Tax=Pseudaeromonas sharmana TaxID=328412 RepID=A0ABV8CKK8_9GAMM